MSWLRCWMDNSNHHMTENCQTTTNMASHYHLVECAINKIQQRYYKCHATGKLACPTKSFGLHFRFSFPWPSEAVSSLYNLRSYMKISEIFSLINGWKASRLAKIDGNFPMISRRSYQKPSLKCNYFCRSHRLLGTIKLRVVVVDRAIITLFSWWRAACSFD